MGDHILQWKHRGRDYTLSYTTHLADDEAGNLRLRQIFLISYEDEQILIDKDATLFPIYVNLMIDGIQAIPIQGAKLDTAGVTSTLRYRPPRRPAGY